MTDRVVPPDQIATEVLFQRLRQRFQSRAPMLYNIWALLGRRHVRDVDTLARALWAPDPIPMDPNERRMRVGAFVAHLNKRIAHEGIVVRPGPVVNTYLLYWKHEWERERQRLREDAIAAANRNVGRKKRTPSLLPRKPYKKRAPKP